MPSKGQGWVYEHVCIGGEDVKITATCNGSTAWASYARQADAPVPCYPDPQPAPGTYDPDYAAANPHYYDPYVYPDGSVTVSNYGDPCDQASLKAWAVAQYPNRR